MSSSDLSQGRHAGLRAHPSVGSLGRLGSQAARYFVDLGWGWEEARTWLADTISLAGFRSGGTSAAAAKLSGSNAPDGMVEQVYRELEALERQSRGRLLAEVTARLARRAATLGSAGLELIAPSTPHSRDALIQLMQWESERSKSERLLGQLRSSPGSGATQDRAAAAGVDLESAHDSPSGIAIGLSQLARRITGDDLAWVTMVEVTLAFGDPAAARDHLLGQLRDLPSPDDGETNEEAAMRERCMRLLALAYFLRGEDEQALGLMGVVPLVLDRSASMGTLRAAAEFRLRQQDPRLDSEAAAKRTHDEFVAPVGAIERRNVARFLSLAHRTSTSAVGESSNDASLGGMQ